jgi:GDPmannose 4,6-dehydratase
VDVTSGASVLGAVSRFRPDAIYYLAADDASSEEPESDLPAAFERCHAVHVRGILHVIEAARRAAPECRIFYAASSRIFGEPESEIQNEDTPLLPTCVYGVTKACGVHCCRMYRRLHGAHVSVGILYNHESPLRGGSFVSRRIVDGAREILEGRRTKLVLGDLSARVDWGYAPDFVDAMVRIVALDRPGDFVVATGQARTVADFVRAVFSLAGLDESRYVAEDRTRIHARRAPLVGDASKLRRETGWRPSVTFEEMVAILWNASGARGASRTSA